ncbi:MAG: phytoene/squalene synthase family protein [Verrucomicrobiota bacterium]
MPNYLAKSYLEAQKVTKHHAKSFFFASIPLSSEKKKHAFAVYAFCRYLDDKVDLALSIESLNVVLHELRNFVNRVFKNNLEDEDLKLLPWLPAFQNTVLACQIPEKYFLDLLYGVEMDQGPVFIQDWEELKIYCYHVAGVVGLMMTRVFQLEDRTYEKHAVDLGIAMQLTNILRDVGEDLSRGRIYLPESELVNFGLSHVQLREKKVDPGDESWNDFMAFQIQRARNYYVSSEDGINHLATDGSQYSVWLMRFIYAAILDEIERAQYDVFATRASTSFFQKFQLAWQAYKKMNNDKSQK